jgi:hypothetical protein
MCVCVCSCAAHLLRGKPLVLATHVACAPTQAQANGILCRGPTQATLNPPSPPNSGPPAARGGHSAAAVGVERRNSHSHSLRYSAAAAAAAAGASWPPAPPPLGGGKGGSQKHTANKRSRRRSALGLYASSRTTSARRKSMTAMRHVSRSSLAISFPGAMVSSFEWNHAVQQQESYSGRMEQAATLSRPLDTPV